MRIAGYEFKDGARFQAGAIQNAAEVGGHLEYLRQQCKGELTPLDVLDDARNGNSPLHSFFEWDDGAAAEQHRLHQARGLIRSVVAVYMRPDAPAARVPAFVHIPESGAPHYRSTVHALSQKKTRELILQKAWREFMEWRRRYADLKELADLFEAADSIEKQLFPKRKA